MKLRAEHDSAKRRPVKTSPPPEGDQRRVVTPGDLRAFFARHCIEVKEVAERRGTTREAVSMALHADATGRPVTQALLRSILATANLLMIEREQEGTA